MLCLARPWGQLHYECSGAPDAPAVIYANALGTDLRLWRSVAARIGGMRHIGFDKRGHGLSTTPVGGWDIGDLADDLVAIMDHLGLERAVIAGCSVGGMIAQDVGARYPGRVTALILSNTAARIGTAASWQERVDSVRQGGLQAIAPAILERWFAPDFRAKPEAVLWGTMLERCDAAGYIGTCGALARADLTAGLGLIAAPVLALAGGHDQSIPAEMVKAMAAGIAGCRFALLPGSGHLPAIDAPAELAALICGFLQDVAADRAK